MDIDKEDLMEDNSEVPETEEVGNGVNYPFVIPPVIHIPETLYPMQNIMISSIGNAQNTPTNWNYVGTPTPTNNFRSFPAIASPYFFYPNQASPVSYGSAYQVPMPNMLPQGQGNSTIRCYVCQLPFQDSEILEEHIALHFEQKNFSCSDCGRRFKRKDHLSSHQRLHTGEMPFQCPDCGIRFRFQSGYAAHKPVHDLEYIHFCPDCKGAFKSETSLKRHKKKCSKMAHIQSDMP